MKKLMKAIAFATVMCMLLSTAAFAANQDVTVNQETKVITIKVTGAAAGNQVSLIVVDGATADYTFNSDTILYINQGEAVDGGATFSGVTVPASTETIDVYAGYAANTATKAEKVAENVPLEAVEAITVEINGDVIIENEVMSAAGDAVGAAVAMTVSFENVTDNLELTKVIFALETAEFGRRYTTAIDVAEQGWGILDGSVQIAAGINNGQDGVKVATIESADAIFLFQDDAKNPANDQEVFTNPETDNVDEKRAN